MKVRIFLEAHIIRKMFVKQINAKKQGDIGLGLAISYFCGLGYTVSIPLTDSQEYDLVVDNGIKLNKIFIRTSTVKKNNGFEVNLRTQGGNYTQKSKQKLFNPTCCDYVFIACSNGTSYYIPSDKITNTSSITVGNKKYHEFKIN